MAHIANGRIATRAADPLPARLAYLAGQLNHLLISHDVASAGVEEVFVNSNGQSTLKLAQARGCLLAALGMRSVSVGEYAPRQIKQAVVGTGAAEKAQVHAMVKRLLPGVAIDGSDAADALAVAITHAHHLASARRVPHS